LVDKEVIELLQDWDGDMSEKSSAATIFFTWMLEFRKLLFTDPFVDASGLDPLPEELTTIIDEVELDVLINILKHDKANWCRAEIQNDQQACLGLLQIALTQALENLKSEFGGDIEDWHWGDAHVATYTHPAFKDTKFGRVAFSLETQSAGSPNTVNVANGSSDPRLVYKQTHGAAFRMVVEMKDTGPELYFSQPVGQSGNVVSGNFSDTLRRFHSQNSNQLVRLRYTKSVSTQTLQPHGHR
jgi:penicillin amidase